MNWSEIYNTARRALFNAGEILRKSWALHFDPTPKDIQVSFYDENGNLKTVLMPNVAKWRKRVWSDAQSAMKRTFYVHQDGDDNGPGTANAPFKTLQKALNAAPAGASVDIILLSDYVIQEYTYLTGWRNVILELNKKTLTIDSSVVEDSEGRPQRNVNNYIRLYSGNIVFRNGNIKIAKEKDTSVGNDGFFSVIRDISDAPHFPTITFTETTIISETSKKVALVVFDGWRGRSGALNIANSTLKNNNFYIAKLYYSSASLIFNTRGCTYDDTNSQNWFAGLVRDSNGNPRNIVSNIIL